MNRGTGLFIIGTCTGLLFGLGALIVREKQHGTFDTKLVQQYEAERLAHSIALAEWKASEDANLVLYNYYLNSTGILQSEIKRLKALPPRVEYVEVHIKVPVEVEVKVPYFSKPRHFKSLEEFTPWLENWHAKFDAEHPGARKDPNYDCDKYCMQLISDAALDGFILGFVLDSQRAHMIVAAIIGNDLYFVEPQTAPFIFHIWEGQFWVVD